MSKKYQILISRLPYSKSYKSDDILAASHKIDERGLICLSIPLHLENPSNWMRLICELEDKGLFLVANIVWRRDRHIVAIKSRRMTNGWEPLAIFSRSKNYYINREAIYKVKKGFEGREAAFDEDEYLTCQGDHWPIRNDRRDRRFLPAQLVMNLGQLGGLSKGDSVLDLYGNTGIKDTCNQLGWKYIKEEEVKDGN